jgi:3',5'-cyclic AMP phosphodiesterase CpdA
MSRFLLAQVTDMHIKAEGRLSYRVVDTATSLARCVEHVNALPQRPDAVIFTGDLTDFGKPEEYAQLARLISPLSMAVYLMPGNHDDRQALRQAFPGHAYLCQQGETIDYVIDDWPLRIVALDTVVPMKSGGILLPRQLQWLRSVLSAAPSRPTLIALHHPPFSTGIGHMDRIGLENAAQLEEVVRDHPQVELLISGHLHRPIQKRFGGTIVSTCPSPAHQVALDLDDQAASRFMMEPPGYQLHLWREGHGVVTHTASIGKFDGPYPFYEGGVLID